VLGDNGSQHINTSNTSLPLNFFMIRSQSVSYVV